MDIKADQKQISQEERIQINREVKAELVEHLYRGCLPGTIAGVPVGIAIFINFYNHTPTYLLIGWFIFYNIALSILTSLYFFYRKYKSNFSLNTWLWAYSIVMCICAVSWGLSVYLMPDNLTRQYFAFIALFLISTGYATGSIGVFELCVVSLNIIILPLVIWCFLKGSFFYNLLGGFSLIYVGFMSSINYRSTQWFKDSLKLQLENNLVSYQANHDLLTGLPNQRLLPQYLEAAIETAKSTQASFALVCFSLNRLEVITDSLGYQAGNSILQSIATRLNSLAGRLGNEQQYRVCISRSDTFNIIISPISKEEAEENISELFSIIEEPFYLETKMVKMTASMGVSLFPLDGNNAEALLINADAAMLQAKRFGGNRLEFYRSEINKELPKRLELESDLHQALKNNQLEVYYQPLIDLSLNQISGMEALLRWKHPTHGFISPLQFIPLAEETGLIIPIGKWVLVEACKQTKKWNDMGYKLKVAVNLSEKQLRHGSIIETIQKALIESKLDVSHLELEITETVILDEAVIGMMQEFKRLGLSLAVDDFGTGYSGLSYLKRFSVDKLKIDQSFIRDLPGNNDSMTIVSAIIAIARELKVRSLAEGVETEEQLELLRNKGCNYVQGYYYSKPVAADNFTELLLNGCNNKLPILLKA